MKVELRGGGRQLFVSKAHETVLAGPADTGKSWSACILAHAICSEVPGAQGAIVRKTFASLSGSVVKTFQRIIKGSPVTIYGGESPSQFIYPNGSRIYLGGMDNPDRVLSSERDFIYTCQTEEFKLDDWEILGTRCSGRGSVVEHARLFGDANPGGSKHWIKERAKTGVLKLLKSFHIDNPSVYEKLTEQQLIKRYPKGAPLGSVKQGDCWFVLTEDGRKRMAVLDSLTGVRRKRLRDGIWATAEGAVYDNFDVDIHAKVRNANEMVRFYCAMDEGYTNPQVNLLVGEDGDGRWHIFQEFYVTGHLEVQIVKQASAWFKDVRSAKIGLESPRPVQCELCSVDNTAPGLIAALVQAGVNAVGGKGALVDSAYNNARGRTSGCNKIRDRLAVQGDGKPRLTVDPSCVNTINEFESYVFKPDSDIPEKENDHTMDAIRYLEDVLNQPTGAFSSSSQIVEPMNAIDRIEIDTERVTFDE